MFVCNSWVYSIFIKFAQLSMLRNEMDKQQKKIEKKTQFDLPLLPHLVFFFNVCEVDTYRLVRVRGLSLHQKFTPDKSEFGDTGWIFRTKFPHCESLIVLFKMKTNKNYTKQIKWCFFFSECWCVFAIPFSTHSCAIWSLRVRRKKKANKKKAKMKMTCAHQTQWTPLY